MITKILLIIFCLVGPLLVMWLTNRYRILGKLGNIILAYIIGCVLGLSGIIPNTDEVHEIQNIIATASVPLAIPLMLFCSDVRAWRHLAPPFLKSLLAGIVAVICAIVIAFLIHGKSNPDLYARTGAMLSGLYTGGTANLASLKIALNVDNQSYLLVHTYSILVSAIYLLFIVVFGQRILSLFMPKFQGDKTKNNDANFVVENHDSELFFGIHKNLKDVGKALILTIIILAIGALLAQLFPEDVFQAIFILIISLLAVLVALIPQVRKIGRTFELGIYFILIFSFAVSSQVSLDMFRNMNFGFFYFVATITFVTLALHVIFNTIMRIDTDTTLVTSISLTCSPPFVPVMAGALRNQAVLGPGIAVGLIGYSLGTYIGLILYNILNAIA